MLVLTSLVSFLQLGIIMSHEIAHTILGHAGELLSYLNFLNAILIVPLVISFKPIIVLLKLLAYSDKLRY